MKSFPSCGRWMLAAIFFGFCVAAVPGLLAEEPATVTVQIVGTGTVSPNYNGQALVVGKSYSMTAKSKSGFTFAGWSGDQTSSKAKLTFVFSSEVTFIATFVDKQKPTLSISGAAKKPVVTNDTYYVTGTAKDNAAVAQVYYSLNGSDPQPASTGNGFSNWWSNISLVAGANTVLAYAVDSSGNVSKTSKLTVTYSAAPTSLAGMTMTVTLPDNSSIVETFGDSTFSEVNGEKSDMAIGTYSYKKTKAVTGSLSLKYTTPPSQAFKSNNISATLQFTDTDAGNFTANGASATFDLTPEDTLAPVSLPDATILFTDDDGVHQTGLAFPQAPAVVDNGNLYALNNPLAVSLGAEYPGQVGDRVQLIFSHQQYLNGAWQQVNTPTYVGTVVDFDNTADTATILFDSSSFLSKSDTYVPLTGNSLSIISYYYANYENSTLVTNGTGTFTFTNVSPVGALLTLSQAGTNDYLVMDFTDDSTSGNYYDETYGIPGSSTPTGASSGSFDVTLPANITTSPQTIGVTNGGNASFSVVAGGTPPLTYQWLFNGAPLTDGTNSWLSVVAGSQTTNLTITTIATNDYGTYQVVVANSYGNVTSYVAQLSEPLPPQITVPPQDTNATSGATAGFYVTATGTPPLSYQWQVRLANNGLMLTNLSDSTTSWGSIISGSTTTNLTIQSTSTNDIGTYQVIVSNSFGSVTSTPPANLTVTDNNVPEP